MSDVRADRINRYANLIQEQTGKAVRPYRADGYVNMLTKYGTEKDSSEHYEYVPDPQVPDEMMELYYESDGLFAKIIDTPAEEAVKHGFELEGIEDQEIIDFCMEALDELDWEETAMTAIKWARLYGGSIAVLLINDGKGLEEPVDWKNIKSIDDIRVYDRSLVQPDYTSMYNYDPTEPFGKRGSRLGMPEFYTVNSKHGSFVVHDSRCLVFQNGRLPENTSNAIYELWGTPEYVRINKAIRDAEIAHGSAPKMLDRSIQAIYKMKDLAMELSTQDGESRVLKRLQLIDMARGLLNSITIDSEGEDYDFRTFPFTGVADVIDTTCNFLSALTSIPQTILFGRSPAGMNSTGNGDLENYYNYVERIQKRMLRKNLRYLLTVIFQAGVASKEVDEVPPINIKFSPLWSMSETEQVALDQQKAQVQQTKANTANVYVQMQVLDPTEVRKKLAESDEFDIDTILDDYTEEELMENAPQGQDPMGGMPGMGGMSGGDMMGGMMGGMEEEPTENSEDAPEAAPIATKLPQDMSEEEKEQYHKTPQQERDEEQGVKMLRTSGSPYRKEKEEKNEDDAEDIEEEDEPNSVGVVCVKDGKILCGTRHNTEHYGKVCGPGGWIDEGEDPEQAARREVEEEFGIRPISLMEIGEGKKNGDGGRPVIFICTDWEGEPRSTDLEMVNPRFLSIEELEELGDDLFEPFIEGVRIMERAVQGKESIEPEEVTSIEQLRKYIEQFS